MSNSSDETTETTTSTFGSAKTGAAPVKTSASSYKKSKTLAIGSNPRRIIPPAFSQASNPKGYIQYRCQHWGWYGVNPKDADKPLPRVFECVKRFGKNKSITQECAACTQVWEQKEALANLEAKLKTQGLSKDQIDQETEVLRAWVKAHNIDKKFLLNTMLESGEFELTAISKTLKESLEPLLEKTENEEGVSPINADGGVWIDFKRTMPPGGKMQDVIDTVDIIYETVEGQNGRRLKQIKMAPLSEAQLARAAVECVDLSKQSMKLSPEKIEALVNCSGDPEEVDAILGMVSYVNEAAKASVPMPVTAKAPMKTKAVIPQEPVEEDDDAEIAAMQAKLDAAKKKPKKSAAAFAEALFADDDK